MNTYTYVSAGPPWWAYVLGVLVLIWFAGVIVDSYNPGHKVKIYKTVRGRRVRDYAAEADLKRRT